MTPNQKRKYIVLPLLILSVVALITMASLRVIFDINLGVWQYVIVPFWIGLFAVTYVIKTPANNKTVK